jgi:hypothetical protein
MTHTDGRLFDGIELAVWLQERSKKCHEDVTRLPIQQVLEQPPEVTAEPLLAAYCVDPIVLRRENWRMDEAQETQVLGTGGLVSARVRSGTFTPGYGTSVHVPFDGDPELLMLSVPVSAGLRPVGHIGQGELVFRFEWLRDNDPLIEQQMNHAVQSIESPYLERQAEEIERFNEKLATETVETLINRRDGYLQAQQYLAGLRIPIYSRRDAPQTYAAPAFQRRRAPQVASQQPGQPPQAILVDEFYEHIVHVISAMARGMERTPADYDAWEEEKLRDALLVILNTHYTGGATGETFNKGGKTDILVRVADRNVFVGECKWWSGPKTFAGTDADQSALDQLLSYTTWRDAKLALTIFVGNQEIRPVIESARTKLEERSEVSCVRKTGDGELRARVRLPAGGDADLAVVFVHLPRHAAADPGRPS